MSLISALNWGDTFLGLWESTGIYTAISGEGWKNILMILISLVLFYLAIAKKFEPLLLVPIAFGMLLINIPGAEAQLYNTEEQSGLLYYLSFGVSEVIYPPLIFLGVGAMTDFGPLIANPKSLLVGGAAQLGVFLTFAIAVMFLDPKYAAAIGMIGGADGPTAIYVSETLKQNTAIIAVAAYSYMALIRV
ncbi:MAG: sodium ion-translocating decarboxylase subunit beta, partial [Clostridiales bacterium]|nr:sodium ion-translocating decarboxylase subunit beta [Clostridiales bacterium]